MDIRRFAGAQGVTLTATVAGDPGDPCVLLLHGAGQTRHAWAQAVRALATAGRFVVAPDLRGHGDSDRAPDGDYGLDALMGDIVSLMGRLPADTAVVGASLGGLLSLAAAGEGRIAPSVLVLVDVAPKLDLGGVTRIFEFVRASPDGFASVEQAAEAVAAHLPHRPRPSDVSGLRKNLRQDPDGRWRWHWDPRFFAQIAQIEPAAHLARFEAAARGLACPVLLVRGALSEIVSEESVRHFRELLPNAEFVDVAGAGHMVAGDRNDAFNAAILEFLERTIRRADPRRPREGFDSRTLRDALGCFGTGVTVVTTRTADGTPVGLTANSFTSVSLDPPLVLFCVDRRSRSLPAFEAAETFAVNVLHIGQQALSGRFAGRDGERFEPDEWETWESGAPVLKDALANFECVAREARDGGDHRIFLAEVKRVRFDPSRDPLLYFQGRYRRVHVPH